MLEVQDLGDGHDHVKCSLIGCDEILTHLEVLSDVRFLFLEVKENCSIYTHSTKLIIFTLYSVYIEWYKLGAC